MSKHHKSSKDHKHCKAPKVSIRKILTRILVSILEMRYDLGQLSVNEAIATMRERQACEKIVEEKLTATPKGEDRLINDEVREQVLQEVLEAIRARDEAKPEVVEEPKPEAPEPPSESPCDPT